MAVVADQDQGAAVIPQKAFEPEGGFEVEVIVGSSSSKRSGSAKRIAASPTRIRQPPERSPTARAGPLVEAEPGEDACRPARCRMRPDLDEVCLDLGDAQRLRPGFTLGEEPCALAVGGEYRLERVAAPLGASWARKPMRWPRGNSIVPSSGCNAPRIKSSRVDFPAPLRPTSPTLPPSQMWAFAGRAAGARCAADTVCHLGRVSIPAF